VSSSSSKVRLTDERAQREIRRTPFRAQNRCANQTPIADQNDSGTETYYADQTRHPQQNPTAAIHVLILDLRQTAGRPSPRSELFICTKSLQHCASVL
jgi:hypothetical protein